MKKPVKIASLLMAGAMAMSMTSCKKEKKETTSTTSETTAATTSETTKETEKETTTTSESESTSETSAPDDSGNSSGPKVVSADEKIKVGANGFSAPAKNCEIKLKDQDKRYHYDMDLKLDEEKHTVSGHVKFDFFNDSKDNWDKLCLRDYSSLFIKPENVGLDGALELNGALTEITNIKDGRDGSSLEYKRDEDVSVVWLELSKALAPNEKMTLEYDFVATVPTLPDRYGLEDGVYNVTNFYPILAEYDDQGWSHAAYYEVGECFYSEISDYDVNITVPSDFFLATTGTESGKKDNGDSTMTYTYYAPCVRDFVFSASDSFEVKEKTLQGVHVNVVYKKGNKYVDDGAIDAAFSAAGDSLAAFDEAFGVYPYDELDIIIAPINAGGMEYPNLIIIADMIINPFAGAATEADPDATGDDVTYEYDVDGDTNAVISESDGETVPNGDTTPPDSDITPPNFYFDKYREFRICVAHEIGHQWFMGIVGSNSGMQPWQDESITSYSEIVYRTYTGELDDTTASQMYGSTDFSQSSQVSGLKSRNMVPLNQSYYEFPDSDSYVHAIYNIGQLALFQIEQAVGRDEFYAVLREYVNRNAFTNADPDSFFEILIECAGKDNEKLNSILNNMFKVDI